MWEVEEEEAKDETLPTNEVEDHGDIPSSSYSLLPTPPTSTQQREWKVRPYDINLNSPPTKVCSLKKIMESNFVFLAFEPQYFDEAIKYKMWLQTMDEEIKMIENNQTWELNKKPRSKDEIGLK